MVVPNISLNFLKQLFFVMTFISNFKNHLNYSKPLLVLFLYEAFFKLLLVYLFTMDISIDNINLIML